MTNLKTNLKKIKVPIVQPMCSVSAVVPHDSDANLALDAAPRDYGLKPNGVTIDMMRENPEFYKCMDDLDRPAVASRESGKLSADVKKCVRSFKMHDTDRNSPINIL